MTSRSKSNPPHLLGQEALFRDLPTPPPTQELVQLRAVRHPVWTEQKAKLISRYLKLFTLVTRHGTYIDGFAGRQSAQANEGWAAELVLALQPRRLRRFYLCDLDPEQVRGLEDLRANQPPKAPNDSKRSIEVLPGNFNELVHAVLKEKRLDPATFCLLDQRTFECRWATVEALAHHRSAGNKIELFYFLPIFWLQRAFIATRTTRGLADIEAWWGRPDWRRLLDLQRHEIALEFQARFLGLGYRHALPFPIVDSAHGDRIMFYMILATDHSAAPKLMWRAYDQAVPDQAGWDQLELLPRA